MVNDRVWLNGEFVRGDSAHVSVYNGGWLHGAGLFETMIARNGRVFRWSQHLARLNASAGKVLAPIPPNRLPDDAVWCELLEHNRIRDARLRLTVTAGDMRATGDGRQVDFDICATAMPLVAYADRLYDQGAAVLVCRYKQSPEDPLAGHKTTNYLGRLMALNQATQSGCDEALWFTSTNLLAEGSISNVFVVNDRCIKTPPVHTPVLPGIARATVLEICERQGIHLEESPVTIDALLDADEVFLTNSVMQVMPVRKVEQRLIRDGQPGPLTRELIGHYRRTVEQECSLP